MKTFYKQLLFISLGIAILVVGGLAIKASLGNIKVNPILGHDLDLNALYYGQAANNTVHDITTQDISISAWVKVDVDSPASLQYVMSKYHAVASHYYGYMVYINSNGTLGIDIDDGTDEYSLDGNTNLKDNKWHYITYIIDRDNASNCKLFKDGYEDGTTQKVGTITNIDSMTTTGILTVGSAQAGALKLDGQIRDVKLYYAAGDHWSDAQVLYQAQHPFDYSANAGTLTDYWRLDEGSGTTLYGKVNNLTLSNALAWTTQPKIKMVNQQNATSTSNNPVGWWKMDEGTASTSYDSSGNGNTGTLTGGVQWATGKLGKGLSFDGVNDYVDGVPINFPSGASSRTVCAWAKMNSLTGNQVIAGYGGAYTDGRWFYIAKLNTVWGIWALGGPYDKYTSTAANTNWNFHCINYDGTTAKYYLNGLEIGSWTVAYNTSVTKWEIGSYWINGSPGAYFNGLIDDVRIYNRALSAGEVGQMYNSTKDGYLGNIKVSTGLVGYWKMDDNDALTSVIDYSGKGNTGTAYSGTATSTSVLSTSTAMVGRAMSFDGVNDYIGISAGTSLNVASAFTLSAWVQNKADNANSAIVGRFDGGGFNYRYYHLGYNGSNISVTIGNGSTYYAAQSSVFLSSQLNTWHYVVGTYNGKTLTLYVDGVYKDSTSPAITPSATGSIRIGATTNTYWFNGLIDEVKIWNYARSAEQVKQDYERGLRNLP